MTRAELLALGGAALVGQSSTISFGAPAVEEGMLPFYCDQKGFFKAAGLDVAFQQFPNGGAVTQAMLGGSLDVGVTNSGSLASAHAHALPIYLVACAALYTPQSPIAHLAVNKTLGVKNARDLSGKTLAVSTIHDMVQASALAWIDSNGGDSKSVSFTELPTVEQPAAILSRRVDGGVIVEPVFTSAKGQLLELGHTYDAVAGGKPFQTLGICANAAWAERNPQLARKLADAIHTAARWANDPRNHDECATIIARLTKIEPAMIASYPRIRFAEANSPAYVQPVIEMLARYGILPKAFPAAELFAPGVA